MTIQKLRQQCLILMAKKGYATKGGRSILAKKINRNSNSVSMALTGYRTGPSSKELLKDLRRELLAP